MSCAFLHTCCLPSKWIWECEETCPRLNGLCYTCARRRRICKHIFPSATTVLSSTNFLLSTKKIYQHIAWSGSFCFFPQNSSKDITCRLPAPEAQQSAYPKTTSCSSKPHFNHHMRRTPPFCLLQTYILSMDVVFLRPNSTILKTFSCLPKQRNGSAHDLSLPSCALSAHKARGAITHVVFLRKSLEDLIATRYERSPAFLPNDILKRRWSESLCAFSQNKRRKTKCLPPVLFLLKLLQNFRMSPPNSSLLNH